MANNLNEFDKLIKDTLENYEAPYDPLHWEELEEELQVTAPGLSSYFSAVTTGLVLTSVVFMGMLFFNSTRDLGNSEIVEETEILEKGYGTEESVGINATLNIEDEKSIVQDADDPTHTNVITKDSEDAIAESSFEIDSEGIVQNSSESTLMNSSGNMNSENYTEEVTEVPTLPSEKNDTDSNRRTGCTGMTINFDASEEYGDDANYLWNFGDGYFSNEANPSHTFNKEGVFDVSLSVTSPSSGQITSNVVQAMIEVVEAPLANLDLEISSANMVNIGNKSFNASEIQWRLDSEILSSKASVSLSLADNTHYELDLIAYNEGGCTDTLETIINSVSAGSEFPRAFETAYGNTFAPGAIIDDGEVTSVKIFEQSTGKVVYEGSGSKGWDGNTHEGTKAPLGKYEWVMIVDKVNSLDVYHGDVQLR